MTSLPSWPPAMSDQQESHLLELATDFALGNGLVYRPPTGPNELHPSTTTVVHAPYSLLPTPFPRHLYDQAKVLQPLYNALYAHVTVDDEFLHQVVGGAVAQVDEFQGKLYDLWKQVTAEGIKQPLHLGLFRSDYLIHAPDDTPIDQQTIKQVEFNTISSSFGALSTRVADLHRYLLRTGAYPDHPNLTLDAIPANPALAGLAAGLATGHKAYGVPDARILMVTQDDERNAFDQRPLEYELLNTHGIHLERVPFSTVHARLSLSSSHQLLLQPVEGSSHEPHEISVVYYRTGYAPTDYYTPREWSTRLLIERSLAIKCPSIALQLAGCKKVQQVLAEPGVLESRFTNKGSTTSHLDPPPVARLTNGPGGHDKSDVDLLQDSFTHLYPLDDSKLGVEGLRLARTDPSRFVLKPQREGGGNNIYKDAIPEFLDQLDRLDEAKAQNAVDPAAAAAAAVEDPTRHHPKEREGYILMSLIQVPDRVESVMVRAGQGTGTRGQVVSELGVYGVTLFKTASANGTGGGGAEILVNETVGTLLRTKGKESDEGGVAVGFSVIDSPLLV